MPLLFWLGWPDGNMVNCYQEGMLRWYLLEKLEPNSLRAEKFWEVLSDDLQSEDAEFIVEYFMGRHWVESHARYCAWYAKAFHKSETDLEVLLDVPDRGCTISRKSQLEKFHKYGFMFKMYDLLRKTSVPLPLGQGDNRRRFRDVIRISFLASRWLVTTDERQLDK